MINISNIKKIIINDSWKQAVQKSLNNSKQPVIIQSQNIETTNYYQQNLNIDCDILISGYTFTLNPIKINSNFSLSGGIISGISSIVLVSEKGKTWLNKQLQDKEIGKVLFKHNQNINIIISNHPHFLVNKKANKPKRNIVQVKQPQMVKQVIEITQSQCESNNKNVYQNIVQQYPKQDINIQWDKLKILSIDKPKFNNNIKTEVVQPVYFQGHISDMQTRRLHALGCSSSFLKCANISLQTDQPVLILQNDALLFNKLQNFTVPANSDVVYLGIYDSRGGPTRTIYDQNYVRMTGTSYGAHAILLVSKKGKQSWKKACEKSIQVTNSFFPDRMKSYPIDCVFPQQIAPTINTYIKIKPFFGQGPSGTSLWGSTAININIDQWVRLNSKNILTALNSLQQSNFNIDKILNGVWRGFDGSNFQILENKIINFKEQKFYIKSSNGIHLLANEKCNEVYIIEYNQSFIVLKKLRFILGDFVQVKKYLRQKDILIVSQQKFENIIINTTWTQIANKQNYCTKTFINNYQTVDGHKWEIKNNLLQFDSHFLYLKNENEMIGFNPVFNANLRYINKKVYISSRFEDQNCKIKLYVQQYTSSDQNRNKQLKQCMNINSKNKQFSIYKIKKELRLTFQQLFNTINNEIKSDDQISIIANSDIIFDETIKYCRYINKNQVFCLTRWQNPQVFNGELLKQSSYRYDAPYSHDVWIFKGKIKNVNNCNFGLGIWGCDGAIADRLYNSGYSLKNPNKTIKVYHHHKTAFRTNQFPQAPKPWYQIQTSGLQKQIIEHKKLYKVVSFCLYGKQFYYQQAFDRIKEIRQLLPQWKIHIWFSQSQNKELTNKIIPLIDGYKFFNRKFQSDGMFYRFIGDQTSDLQIIRDIDAKISIRQIDCLNRWIKSGKTSHTIKDHSGQRTPGGGLIGFLGNKLIKQIGNLAKEKLDNLKSCPYGTDQNWLSQKIWDIIKNNNIHFQGTDILPRKHILDVIGDGIGRYCGDSSNIEIEFSKENDLNKCSKQSIIQLLKNTTWSQYNNGNYCCQKTFLNTRMSYGPQYIVHDNLQIEFDDHILRFDDKQTMTGIHAKTRNIIKMIFKQKSQIIHNEIFPIFIHIPKNAGTTLTNIFKTYGIETYCDNYYSVHTPAQNSNFSKYNYKIAFCRNPYQRLYSFFCYKYGKSNKFSQYVNQLNLHKAKLKYNNITLKGRLDKFNICQMCPPQHIFTHINGINQIDYIGRVQQINFHINQILMKIKNTQYINKIDKLNQSSKLVKNYQQVYTKNEIDIIKSIYQQDFNIFGYSMEL